MDLHIGNFIENEKCNKMRRLDEINGEELHLGIEDSRNRPPHIKPLKHVKTCKNNNKKVTHASSCLTRMKWRSVP